MTRNSKLASTIASALESVRERESPDTCLHFEVRWAEVTRVVKGRKVTKCPGCGSQVSRRAA